MYIYPFENTCRTWIWLRNRLWHFCDKWSNCVLPPQCSSPPLQHSSGSPEILSGLWDFFFRKETCEKNAFATRLYFFPRVSLSSTQINYFFLHLPASWTLNVKYSKIPQCLSEISVPKRLESVRPPNKLKSLWLSIREWDQCWSDIWRFWRWLRIRNFWDRAGSSCY